MKIKTLAVSIILALTSSISLADPYNDYPPVIGKKINANSDGDIQYPEFISFEGKHGVYYLPTYNAMFSPNDKEEYDSCSVKRSNNQLTITLPSHGTFSVIVDSFQFKDIPHFIAGEGRYHILEFGEYDKEKDFYEEGNMQIIVKKNGTAESDFSIRGRIAVIKKSGLEVECSL